MTSESQETRRFDRDEIQIAPLAPGVVLSGRYRLDSELGRGGMGVVYRATDLELEREVAVKVLPQASSSNDARERFVREARSAATLNHPHIVAVYDVGEDYGIPFLVMELVEGPSLRQAQPDDIKRVVEIACQICDALDHAHANNIVHRDLKPENVLLSGDRPSGKVKLADLGLALHTRGSRISRAGLIVGTAAYMAPEQALGQPVDGRTDLYALGVVLYRLTTGRLPFMGDDPLTIISQHVNAPVVPPRALRPNLPRALETVILRLLAKDPAQRFATASETGEALRAAMEAPESESDEGSAATVTLLDALSRGRLVGRTVELAQARDLWRRAREGRGYAVLVGGEPGAGKTRFAREVIIQAALDGAMVLTGACYEYEATTPYLPFVEAFRRWVREQKSDTKLSEVLGDASAQLAKLAPEIETRIGPFPERHELPPHEERLLFFDTVAKALAELAHSQGLLFYIDDLHWADSGTLWLLGHLLRYTRDKRVLVVASYRETELHRSHPLAKALVDWNRERLTARIVLRRFTRDETQAQLSALLGQEDFADFADAVHRETEGNPFFIEEVLKALIEQGSVRREGGRWERSEIGDLVIPQSVKEAIGNRLDRVSQKCNDVLRAAAVLGKTFTFDELMAATGSNEEEALLDALDEGVAAQLIASDREAAFTFTHDKIREVLYEELNPIRRRRLHRRTAEGLERAREQNSVPVETLAHHYIEAGDYERGLDYAKRAAVEAERVFAFDEAIAAYGRARDCAESLGLIDEQVALEEAIGKACILSGDSIRASEHFERALVLATEPVQRARLQCEAASSLVTTGDKRGLDYVREALATLDPGTYPLETANALSIEGRFHHLAGMHHKAVELLEKAVELATPAVESATLTSFAASTITNIYAYLSGAHQHLGRFADADRWARRNLDFGNKYNVPLAQATGYEFLGEDACSSGDWKMGLEYAAREREIAAKLHSRERLAWTYMVTSLCAMFLGDLEYAERESVDGIALAQSVGERRLVTLLMGNLAIFQADLGQLDQALETGRENFERAEVLGLPYSRTEARRCLAHVRLRRGELAEALRLCEEVLELVAGTESRISRLWLGPLHVETLMAAGRDDEAKERLSAYRELVSECQSPLFERETTRLERLLQNN